MSDFFLDPWHIRPSLNQIQRDDEVRRLGSKVMDLLVCLAERPNQPVSKEELIARVWQGEFTTEESLTTAVYELRKALDDDARCPKFIGTVRGRGYRLLTPVETHANERPAPDHAAGVKASEPSAEHRAAANEKSPARPISPSEKHVASAPSTELEIATAERRLPRAAVIIAVIVMLSLSAFLVLRRTSSSQITTDLISTASPVGDPTGRKDRKPATSSTSEAEATTSNPSKPATTNVYASGPRAVCSVVVVPIESLTADPESSVFAQGLSEQLAQDLAQKGTLAVVPGYSSVMSGRLSSDLSTDAVVEGSVQSSDTRLWIRMQMVDTLGGRLLWGGTYAHELGNSLDLQQELSKEITHQILEQIEPVADCASSGFERPDPQEPG